MADLSSLLGAAGIGGAIGKAIVSLELETTKYQGELKTMQAETVASTNSSSSAFSKFGGIANAALLGVGVAAVAGAALSVKAAIEANDAHLKLQNTFENNAKLSDSSVAAFEAQADALRDLTGVDDEAIITGQALLGAFDLTGKEVQQLIPLIVDLSAKYGIDMEAASKAVGKAINGSTGALARYGVVLDKAALESDAFGAVLQGLGKNAGYAADRADAEPWRILSASMEEVAEKVGQALIPALQGLAGVVLTLIPLLERLAELLQYLPLVQMGEDADSSASRLVRFGDALIDTVPVLGHFISLAGEESPEALAKQQQALDKGQAWVRKYHDELYSAGEANQQTLHYINEFAIKSGVKLKEWRDAAHEAIDGYIDDLSNLSHRAEMTKQDFVEAMKAMADRARKMADAFLALKDEDWINPKFLAFLVKEGPEAVISFEKLNEDKQHSMQQLWKQTADSTDIANGAVRKMTDTLDEMDKTNTHHRVVIEYEYQGFDPSKPGMSVSRSIP